MSYPIVLALDMLLTHGTCEGRQKGISLYEKIGNASILCLVNKVPICLLVVILECSEPLLRNRNDMSLVIPFLFLVKANNGVWIVCRLAELAL
jgi:hypothetical protein